MGKYRHVTDLAGFASTLNTSSLRLSRADDVLDDRPELPVGVSAMVPIHGERNETGQPVLSWTVIEQAVRAAVEKGVKPEPHAGHSGRFVCIGLSPDFLAACAFDTRFTAAIDRGDAVIGDGALYVRVDTRVLN